MRIGIVDVDTSHPQNWIPIERDLGHEVVGIYDAGDVHPAQYVKEFAAEHGVPRVYDELQQMVDDVDCAIIHACDWDRHIDRAAPFIDAGKSVLLDKPVVGNLADAQQLLDWAAAGHRVTGGSSLRFAAEVVSYLDEPIDERGTVHTAFAGCGTDEYNYGIHAYSLLSAVMGPGIRSVRFLGASGLKHLQVTWSDGRLGYLAVGDGAWLPFHVTAITDKGVRQITCDTKTLYRELLQTVLPYLAGDVDEPPLSMRVLLEPELAAMAARQSWLRGGAEIFLNDLKLDDEGYDGEVFAWGYRRAKDPTLDEKGLMMAKSRERKLLEEIRQFDTPSVTNVVATYPSHPLCLGLYHPLSENWYTDDSLRCMYPDLGAMAGYAVTAVYGPEDPTFKRLSGLDVYDAIDASPRPSIFCFQQKFPPELAGKIGLSGGNMTTAMKALGCIGAVSNGPSRDIDEIRPMKFQYLLSGVSPGHGGQDVYAVNVPVHIAGMDVAPGEIVHMDENGACKFPADRLQQVVDNLYKLRDEEEERMGKLAKAKSAADVRAIFSGQPYGKGSKKKPG